MAKNLKGTKTEANLQAAFAGESQARNKYTYYASKAKKEGYVQIANLFEDLVQTAARRHARHRRQPCGRSRGRKLRMDGYVRDFRKRSEGRRL